MQPSNILSQAVTRLMGCPPSLGEGTWPRFTYSHARDHAVVVFDGELDWDAARELVKNLDTVVGDYFYTVVELVVSSPGRQDRRASVRPGPP